jgi:hypothetical protein
VIRGCRRHAFPSRLRPMAGESIPRPQPSVRITPVGADDLKLSEGDPLLPVGYEPLYPDWGASRGSYRFIFCQCVGTCASARSFRSSPVSRDEFRKGCFPGLLKTIGELGDFFGFIPSARAIWICAWDGTGGQGRTQSTDVIPIWREVIVRSNGAFVDDTAGNP